MICSNLEIKDNILYGRPDATDEEIYELSQSLKIEIKELKNKVNSLKEFNPMMGLRGCRLGIIYPEITSMQAEAIFKALINVKKEGYEVNPEIMIPLVGDVKELKYLKDIITKISNVILKGSNIKYKQFKIPRRLDTTGFAHIQPNQNLIMLLLLHLK